MQTKMLLASLVFIISMSSSSMAQRTKEEVIPRQNLSLTEIISRFVSNTSDSAVYFHAIPADVYYNHTIERPLQDIKHMFNLTGLSSEDIPIVLAFPYMNEDNKTESTDDKKPSNETIGYESESDRKLEEIPEISQNMGEFSARSMTVRSSEPQNAFAFLNPMTWFQRPTTTTTAPPVEMINNYFIRPNEAQPLPSPPQAALPNKLSSVVPQPQIQSSSKITASAGIMTNPLGTKVQTPILTRPTDELQNVEYTGLSMNYPSYPLVSAARIMTDSQPRPEYPSNDGRPSLMEVIYS